MPLKYRWPWCWRKAVNSEVYTTGESNISHMFVLAAGSKSFRSSESFVVYFGLIRNHIIFFFWSINVPPKCWHVQPNKNSVVAINQNCVQLGPVGLGLFGLCVSLFVPTTAIWTWKRFPHAHFTNEAVIICYLLILIPDQTTLYGRLCSNGNACADNKAFCFSACLSNGRSNSYLSSMTAISNDCCCCSTSCFAVHHRKMNSFNIVLEFWRHQL